MSGVLGTYAYTAYFGVEGGYRQGGITSAMPGGSLVGALASSFIADRFSRKVAIQMAAVTWIVGSMSASSPPHSGTCSPQTVFKPPRMVLLS